VVGGDLQDSIVDAPVNSVVPKRIRLREEIQHQVRGRGAETRNYLCEVEKKGTIKGGLANRKSAKNGRGMRECDTLCAKV